MKKLFLTILLITIPITVFGQAEITDPAQAVSALSQIFSSIMAKNYAMAAALSIFVLVFVLREYVLPEHQGKNSAIYAALLGVLAAVGARMYTGADVNVGGVVASGVMLGNAATGFYETFVKRFIKPKTGLIIGQK